MLAKFSIKVVIQKDVPRAMARNPQESINPKTGVVFSESYPKVSSAISSMDRGNFSMLLHWEVQVH